MSSKTIKSEAALDLRLKAVSRMTGRGTKDVPQSASAAFGVLHELASSPSTAADALALLHELQVHQVELDLQAEELRNSRVDLEQALERQVQLYESAPVGCFTVDPTLTLRELNATGAALLEAERDALLGQPLLSFLSPKGARVLQGMLTRVGEGCPREVCTVELAARAGSVRTVYACVHIDPAERGFLIAFM